MAIAGFLNKLVLLVLCFCNGAFAVTASYCSSQNTGTGFNVVSNHYQSLGSCSVTCSGYTFAIAQGANCWCSNIAPGITVDVGNCNVDCPGYPYEFCGNADNGLFGYVVLNDSPRGTASGSSLAATSTPSPDPGTVTALATVTSVAVSIVVSSAISVQVSSIVVIPSSVPSPVTTSTSENTPTPTPTLRPSSSLSTVQVASQPTTSTWTPTPSPSVMTISGSVKTVVITPSAPPQATTTVTVDENQPAQHSGFFANKGAVGGVFTVIGLFIAGLFGFLAWVFWRRRKTDHEGSERLDSFQEERGSRTPTYLSRRTSELGLKTDIGAITRGHSDEKTPTSAYMTPANMSRRTSMPLTDQRLNPMAVFHDTGSHVSIASLQDNQDYSRPVLQIANPDRPDASGS